MRDVIHDIMMDYPKINEASVKDIESEIENMNSDVRRLQQSVMENYELYRILGQEIELMDKELSLLWN